MLKFQSYCPPYKLPVTEYTKVHGTIYFIKNPHECSDWSHLRNKVVEIDGVQRLVRGVEYYAVNPPFKKDSVIGLLV